MRGEFELSDTNDDFYRLHVLAKQGYHIYLNGALIRTYIWWKDGLTDEGKARLDKLRDEMFSPK